MDEHALLEEVEALIDACAPPLDLGLDDDDGVFVFSACDAQDPLLETRTTTGMPITASFRAPSPPFAASVQPATPAPAITPAPRAAAPRSTKTGATAPRNRRPRGTKSGRPPVKNPSRERMHAELAFLRQRVVEMEQELDGLRQRQGLGADSALQLATTEVAWEQVAAQEREKLRGSESENTRLRSMLDRQICLAKSLEHTLRKRSSAALSDLLDGGRNSKKRSRFFDDVETQWLQFLNELDLAYLQVDKVLEESGLKDQRDDSRSGMEVKIRPLEDGSEELFVEVRDFKVFPFVLQETARAGWRAAERIFTQDSHRQIQMYRREDDYFAIKYQSKKQASGGAISSESVTMVMKRFMSADRMVVIWRSIAIPSRDSSEQDEHGKYTDETGYSVFKATKCASGKDTTCMVSCMHLVPRLCGTSAQDTDTGSIMLRVGDVTRMVIGTHQQDDITTRTTLAAASFQRDMGSVAESVETMLLEDPATTTTP